MAKEEEKNTEEENQEEPESENKEDTIEVSKDLLEEILESNKRRDEQIEELKEKNKMLEEISDKGRKQRYQSEHSDELVKVIRIPYYKTPEGRKRIAGWEAGTDEVGYTREGKPFFKQTVVLHLVEQDKEGNEEIRKEEVDYSLFYKNTESERAEVLEEKEIKTKNGSTIAYRAKMEDGEEVEIDSKFINAF